MQQTITVIIVDDEQPAVDVLTHFVNEIPHLELKLATTNSIEALNYLKNNSVDLVFLDIEMPDLTGIEFVKSLDSNTMVIFTTAYSDYAIEGFNLDVVDYLLKPIRFGRFNQAINKVDVRKNGISIEKPLSTHITIKVEYKTVRLALDDIKYIEGCKDYVKIYFSDKMVMTRLNIKNIMQKLPSEKFVRTHRSFIISVSKVTSYQKLKLNIEKVEIPIGEQYRDVLFNLLEKN